MEHAKRKLLGRVFCGKPGCFKRPGPYGSGRYCHNTHMPGVVDKAAAAYKRWLGKPGSRAKIRAAVNTPAAKRRKSEALRRWHKDPANRERHSAAASAGARRRFKNPTERAKVSAGQKRYYADPANRERHSAILREAHKNKDPALRRANSRRRKAWFANPANKARFIAAINRPDVVLKRSGPNNPSYKGGRLVNGYSQVWCDQEYMHAIFSRDGYRCQHCGVKVTGKRGRTFWNRHHINGDRADDRPENLLTMCHSCHMRHHNQAEYYTTTKQLKEGKNGKPGKP